MTLARLHADGIGAHLGGVEALYDVPRVAEEGGGAIVRAASLLLIQQGHGDGKRDGEFYEVPDTLGRGGGVREVARRGDDGSALHQSLQHQELVK